MKLCSKRYNVTRMDRWTDTPPDTTATLLDRTDHESSQPGRPLDWTDRQTSGHTSSRLDRPTTSQQDRRTDRHALLHRQIPSHADRQTGRQAGSLAERQIYRVNRQTDQTDTWTVRQRVCARTKIDSETKERSDEAACGSN